MYIHLFWVFIFYSMVRRWLSYLAQSFNLVASTQFDQEIQFSMPLKIHIHTRRNTRKNERKLAIVYGFYFGCCSCFCLFVYFFVLWCVLDAVQMESFVFLLFLLSHSRRRCCINWEYIKQHSQIVTSYSSSAERRW